MFGSPGTKQIKPTRASFRKSYTVQQEKCFFCHKSEQLFHSSGELAASKANKIRVVWLCSLRLVTAAAKVQYVPQVADHPNNELSS